MYGNQEFRKRSRDTKEKNYMKQKIQSILAIMLGTIFLSAGSILAQRQRENLGRGMVAIHQGDGMVYVGWRMLGTDPVDIAFNLYRSTGGGTAVKLNDQFITQSTNWVDDGINLSQTNSYFVRPVLNGQELAVSAPFTLPENPPERNYLSIPLQGDYVFNRAGVGDLDGDGEYDYIIKQPEQVTDPGVYSPSVDTWKIEAYKNDGTFLWRRDLGWNIVQGVWWSPMIVYDLDGDGKAEVVTKTAPTDVDYRRPSDGRVLEGPEWFTVFDGQTGAELATEDWIPRGNICDWGDCYGNRVNRNLMCVAYLDGERPSVVIFRGTYGLMKAEAWNFRNGQLENVWRWSNEGLGSEYQEQGFHEVRVGDIDGDGRDEILNGSIAIDDDGSNIYTTGEGHGDRFHLTDIDPNQPGLETWYIQEDYPDYTHPVHLRDARTGELLWGLEGNWGDVGRGLVADIDPRQKGLECWSPQGDLYNCKGDALGPQPNTCQFAIWWDDDLLRELLENGRIQKWNPYTQSLDRIGNAELYTYSDILIADIFGDWREEIITVPSEGGQLRIYTTTIPSTRRFPTFMHDPIYRIDVATMSMGYTQSAHPSFYFGADEQLVWPVSLEAIADVEVGNDSQLGPNASSNGVGLGVRNIPTRRRVAYLQYDISDYIAGGSTFTNMRFSNFGHDLNDPIDVYGIIESQDDLPPGDDVEDLTWNTAPGVQNDPSPPLGDPVALDLADVVGPLMTFTPPPQGERQSTPISLEVADFLNDDTDGMVIFMFSTTIEGDQAIIRSSEDSSGGTFLLSELKINKAPEVNVGPDQYLWLGNALDPATAMVNLHGTVTDDGLPTDTLMLQWEQISGPVQVIISPDDTEDISLEIPETGVYHFRLTASDTNIYRSDTGKVVVQETPCHAAQAMPGYTPFPGDLNLDCMVDLRDLGILTAHWLSCNSLDCP
jgi:rhamnogalacturonan endolyase